MKLTIPRNALICSALANGVLVPFAAAQDTAPPAQTPVIEVDAGVSLTLEYSDNVFLTANDKRGDWVVLLAPWVDVTVESRDYQLRFGASAEIASYADNSSEDYEDVVLSADGRFRLGPSSFAFGGLEFSSSHEDRNSPDDVNGLEPTDLRDISGYFGFGGTWQGRSYRLGVNVRDLDFEDTPAAGGITFNNDDRDRQEFEVGGRLGVASLGDGEVFVQGILNQRDYDQTLDDAGRARSSRGVEASVGYSGSIGPLEGEVTVGVLSQNYDDAGFETVTVPDIGLELVWQPSRATRVTGIVDRTIEETTLAGASGYVSTSAGVRLRHRAAQDVSLATYFFLTENKYEGIARTDTIAEAGAEIRYFFNPRVYLDAGYGFQQRLSDVAGVEYSGHRVYLSLGTDRLPNYEPRAGGRTRFDNGTLYVGSQIGFGTLQSTVDGPRGAGGSLTADFGDSGGIAGVFAGYRKNVGSLVLGAEADIEFSGLDWTHTGGRTFSVETGNTVGLSAIVGYMTPSRNLLYGRFGVFATDFESTYARAGDSAAISGTETGFSIGLGTEVPLGRGMSARMEYQIRNFSDYELGAVLGGGDDDNFANLQTAVRFGLVYDLGGNEIEQTDIAPTDFGGAYAGGTLGHNTLLSNNTGPRPAGATPAFTLDVTRAGQGFTGSALAGYGWQRNSLYVGVEAELETSSATWNIERDPTGRVYSLDKVGAVNAMLRVGKVVNDSVLIYGRAGVSVGKFDTDYTFAGSTTLQSDTLSGLRVGLGVEYAVAPKTHLRVEYNYTDYGTFSVDYGAGVDTFDTSESLFQVGMTYQF